MRKAERGQDRGSPNLLGQLLGLTGLALALGLLLALIVSNYSLTPANAKLGLAVPTAILAVAFGRHAWQVGATLVGRSRPPRTRLGHRSDAKAASTRSSSPEGSSPP